MKENRRNAASDPKMIWLTRDLAVIREVVNGLKENVPEIF